MVVESERLPTASRLWRLVLTAAVAGTLLYTSSRGSDDDFPLGPMTQFAFAVKSDGGEIHSHWLEADTADGRHLALSRDALATGLKRAEVEGQMNRFIRNPALLQGVADAHRRLQPGQPPYTKIYVVKQVKTLRHGRVVATSTWNEVTWEVRG